MKVDIESPASWSRRLKITVPADRVERERRSVATQVAKRVRMPGFRKGRVPSSVLEKHYGASIEQQTLERMVNTAYREALKEQGFSPISEAAVENVSYQPGADLSFDVAFEVRPEIELERLGGFTVKAPAMAVSDADVDRVVDRLREERAVWHPRESGAAEAGDKARVEITPLRGAAAESPEPREYEVVLGAGEILYDIDQAIRGLEAGAETELDVTVPDEDESHRIGLKLVSAHRPELPEADDEFARAVGDFETMDALRARIREDLEAESARESDREVRRQLIGQVLEANPFQPPPSLVDQYLDGLRQAPEDADPDELAQAREQARPAAEYGVRRMLVIERIAELESLHPTQEDMDARVAEIAARNDMDLAQVRRQLVSSGRIQALASDIAEARVFDYLKALSTIVKEDEK